MIKQLFFLVICLALFSVACKSENQETNEESEMAQDTTATVGVVDSAAITALYAASHAKKVPTNQNMHKSTESGKMAKVDSDPVINHHESSDDAAIDLMDENGYYFHPSKWASFPGGEVALDKYLEDNIKYPAMAVDNDVEGTVYATMYVDESGNLVDVAIAGKRIGYGLEEEVLRVLKKMPVWTPGENNDQSVKTKFTLPVTFDLQ